MGLRIYNGYLFFFDWPDRSGWIEEGADRKYQDRHGGYVKGELIGIDSDFYYFDMDGLLVKGEIALDGYLYSFDDQSGRMKTGWAEKGGKRYYYDELGRKIIDREYAIGGRDFLFDADGAEHTGAVTIGGKDYYFEPLRGKLKNGEKLLDGAWYYYTEDGSRLDKGWAHLDDGRICFYDGEAGMLRGEQVIDGQPYLLNISTGGRMTGTVYYDGEIYTIADDGVIGDKERTPVWDGIDVSVHQEAIDWQAVKESGVQFAIIRAGYFASEEWVTFVPDRLYVRNVLEAQKQGISVGAYIYLYAFTEDRIAEGLEAFNFLTETNRIMLDLPVFLDIEDEAYFRSGSEPLGGYEYRTDLTRFGMEYLEDLGYSAGFYTFHQWANGVFDADRLYAEGYPFWLARWYDNNEDLDPATPAWNDERQPDLWQYRATGIVPGIEKEVDMNYLYWNR